MSNILNISQGLMTRLYHIGYSKKDNAVVKTKPRNIAVSVF